LAAPIFPCALSIGVGLRKVGKSWDKNHTVGNHGFSPSDMILKIGKALEFSPKSMDFTWEHLQETLAPKSMGKVEKN
jgi:hypothetical protein